VRPPPRERARDLTVGARRQRGDPRAARTCSNGPRRAAPSAGLVLAADRARVGAGQPLARQAASQPARLPLEMPAATALAEGLEVATRLERAEQPRRRRERLGPLRLRELRQERG